MVQVREDRGKDGWAMATYLSARRKVHETWLVAHGIEGRSPADTASGGDCLFTSVSRLVGTDANMLRAAVMALARLGPQHVINCGA